MELGETCSSTCGTCSVLSNQQDVLVSGCLPFGYIHLTTFIEFNISNITNPEFAYQFANIEIQVQTKSDDFFYTYHKGVINITNDGSYNPHNIETIDIDYTHSTSTNTSYSFSFQNIDFPVPAGSVIMIKFPSQFKFLSSDPKVTNLQNISNTAIYEFAEFRNYFYIKNGFEDNLEANNIIQFTVADILNPHIMKMYNNVSIIIYKEVGNEDLFIFANLTRRININLIGEFDSFDVESKSRRTGCIEIYRFSVGIGQRGLEDENIIKIEKAEGVQHCDMNTINFTSPVKTGDYGATGNIYYFYIQDDLNTPKSVLQFQMNCQNPYTTRPSGKFTITAYDDTYPYYQSTAEILDMNILNDFKAVYSTLRNSKPRDFAVITFTIEMNLREVGIEGIIDQIEIKPSDQMEIVDCIITEYNNGSNIFPCKKGDDHNIIRYELPNNLSLTNRFKVMGIRNPALVTDPIDFIITTSHSDGYKGESYKTPIEHTLCNYPCRECNPHKFDECTRCYPENSDIFNLNNIKYFRRWNEGKKCVAECPSHTFQHTHAICQNCHHPCSECEINNNQCTQCYPDSFLYDKQCITPCPLGFGGNITDWKCHRNIYIYIYIYY